MSIGKVTIVHLIVGLIIIVLKGVNTFHKPLKILEEIVMSS